MRPTDLTVYIKHKNHENIRAHTEWPKLYRAIAIVYSIA